ncbi:MAG: alpha/beta hydrolase [Hyphomonadaceae bacterium]|nr:alpha/beta hydrolase [Hyphomonadaceae bacterium]
MSPTHLKLRANGLTHHVAVMGEGPALILLHGWMGSSYHWRKVMPLLAARHTVIAPDARGYGESDKPAYGYDGRTLVKDVCELAEFLTRDRYFVLGHDMGALTALLLAADHPEEVRGLIYVDEPLPGYNLDQFTAFRKENPFVYWWFAFNAQLHVPAMMWSGKEAELVDYFLTAMAADPTALTAADKAEYVRGLRKPGGLEGSFGWYRDVLVTADQIRDATRTKLTRPVLAVNGAYGHPNVGEQMRLVADEVTSVTLADCGHLCAEEKPEELAAAILAFTASAP